MNKRIQELAVEARLKPVLLLRHWGTASALTDTEQEELAQIEKFAALVAAHEREECAKLCEKQYEYYGHDHVFAKAIRARSNT